jgi:hypothetical protein
MVPGLELKEAKTPVDEYIDGDRALEDILEDLKRREAPAEKGVSAAGDAKERKRARDGERQARLRVEKKASGSRHAPESAPEPVVMVPDAVAGPEIYEEMTWILLENLGNDGLREKLRERGLSLAVVHHT